MSETFEIVVIGSGFGSSFFLYEALGQLSPKARCLVLERGQLLDPAWQLANGRNSDIDMASTIHVPPGHKRWQFTIGFGGGTNCWTGVTPRLHPTDFELRSRYGVGNDWPIGYNDLEPYYTEAETILGVAGDGDIAQMYPRSGAYPQPGHRLTTVDRLMKAAMPGLHFALPSARSSVPSSNRGVCCTNATCSLCPANAKFNVFNGMSGVYTDPRVELRTGAEVISLGTEAGRVTRVRYRKGDHEFEARGNLVVLGANAIFSAAILQRSGITNAATGRYLHEQLGGQVEVLLRGLDHFDGGTASTGINYALFDGPHRRDVSGVNIVFHNRWIDHGLRLEPGRWRQTLPLLIVAECLPRAEDRVTVSDDSSLPLVSHERLCDYAVGGIDRARRELLALLAPLPVEDILWHGYRPYESHVQGTLRMGRDPQDSVVNADLMHHSVRNLVVVGTAVLPSCGTANPSLTAAALSLRSARRLL